MQYALKTIESETVIIIISFVSIILMIMLLWLAQTCMYENSVATSTSEFSGTKRVESSALLLSPQRVAQKLYFAVYRNKTDFLSIIVCSVPKY